VEHLTKLGFFNEKTTCAHSVWLDSKYVPHAHAHAHANESELTDSIDAVTLRC